MNANKQRAKTEPTEKEHLDDLLDEALEETFPASDPIAVNPALDEGDDCGADTVAPKAEEKPKRSDPHKTASRTPSA